MARNRDRYHDPDAPMPNIGIAFGPVTTIGEGRSPNLGPTSFMVEPFINDICNMAESMLSKAANEKKPSFGPERPPSSRATKDNDTAADSAEQADDKHDAHQDDEEEAQVGASQDITNNDSSDNKPFTLGCGLCPIWLTENPLAWNVHAAEVHDFYWVGTGGRGFNREGITAAPTIASDEDLKIKKELIRYCKEAIAAGRMT